MARVIRFAHIGLAVSNVAEAESFYAKVGYRRVWPYRPGVLVNSGGLELHMMQAEKPSPAAGNVLMDMPDDAKFPGINHMSFGVRSVLATRTYLEGSGIEISGTRANLAVFVRDPDRTVLEFERNDGGNEDGLVVTADVLSAVPRGGIDHVGIRVSNPEGAVEWYRRNLGFSKVTMKYELEADSIKNFRPWIVQTEHGKGQECDINLILNCTNTSCGNALLTKDGVLPGILYVAFQVEDVAAAAAALRANGVEVVEDADVGSFGLPPKLPDVAL
mmetsp:Transcript_42876/g.85981  ORF Transcript_42876/g.85981 Transcript_42876/m.85981 type:complete len:274 (+) Transcript_42876:156-977(+)